MERKKAYYWCTCLQMITPIKVRRLIEEAGGPSEVFGQSDEKLVQMGFTAREQRIYHEALRNGKNNRGGIRKRLSSVRNSFCYNRG